MFSATEVNMKISTAVWSNVSIIVCICVGHMDKTFNMPHSEVKYTKVVFFSEDGMHYKRNDPKAYSKLTFNFF